MKKKDWDARFGMDHSGVQLLGAALLGRAQMRLDEARRQLKGRLDAPEPVNEFEWLYDAEYYEADVRSWEKEYREYRLRLKALETPRNVIVRALELRPMDFRFRWDQLRDHLVLVGYISDDQPHFAKDTWDRETPISERWGDAATEALARVFHSEYRRLTSLDPEGVPDLQAREDFLFYLTVWKHCELEAERGHPKGPRWKDGRQHAASHALSLKAKAEELGTPISTEEAIRRSLKCFMVISASEFEAHPDKRSVIVSDASGEGQRLGGATKIIRKIIAAWELEEREAR